MISIIYIHGFNSSPASMKARMLVEAAASLPVEVHVPVLPPDPRQAMQVLEQTLARCGQPPLLLGSSLGGFYATWLAEHHGLKAVLINPAVAPWRLLHHYVGENRNYHTGERWHMDASWVDLLKAYEVDEIRHPENLLVMVQTGDETLDWHDAADYYQECSFFKQLGGSHGFNHFRAHLPLIFSFAGLSSAEQTLI